MFSHFSGYSGLCGSLVGFPCNSHNRGSLIKKDKFISLPGVPGLSTYLNLDATLRTRLGVVVFLSKPRNGRFSRFPF